MAKHEINITFSNQGTRNEVRLRVINVFSTETPGEGKGENVSKYIYYVETLNDGKRIYLERPANLHNGFDFKIHVEGMDYSGSGRNAPKHEDIHEDLLLKKESNRTEYARLYQLIQRIYDCEDINDEEMTGFNFTVGLPVDHILKTIKWLFIEQDIRYWNYSGRKMTWNIVPEP